MKSQIGHIIINISMKNIRFYEELFRFLGWSVYHKSDGRFAVMDENGTRLWFLEAQNATDNDYDGVGMNHLAVEVHSQADVDSAFGFLGVHKIPALFGTPCHRPEFSKYPGQTYYQVMFESPDNLLFEIIYKGRKD